MVAKAKFCVLNFQKIRSFGKVCKQRNPVMRDMQTPEVRNISAKPAYINIARWDGLLNNKPIPLCTAHAVPQAPPDGDKDAGVRGSPCVLGNSSFDVDGNSRGRCPVEKDGAPCPVILHHPAFPNDQRR